MRFINDGELHGLQITGTIMPCTDKDKYATHDSKFGLGGWHEVVTIEQRDNIPEERRRLGMACYVKSEGKLYILRNNLLNTGWVTFTGSTNAVDIIKEAIANGQIELNVDLANYYNIDQTNEMLEPLAVKTEVDKAILEAVEEIKDWVIEQDYVSNEIADEKFLSKEDAEKDYVSVETFNEFLEENIEDLKGITTKLEELEENSATKEELAELKDDLEAVKQDYVSKVELGEKAYVNADDVKGILEDGKYVTEEKLDELDVVKKDNIDELLTDFVKKDDIDIKKNPETGFLTVKDLKGYATVALLNDTVANLNVLTLKDLKGYATEAWVRDYVALNGGTGSEGGTVDLTGYVKTSDMTIALADYVSKQALLEKNYARMDEVTEALSEFSELVINEVTEKYATKEETSEKYVAKDELEAKGYLTEHQDLSGYVKVSELEEKGYLTEHQDLSDYVTVVEFEGVKDTLDNTRQSLDNALLGMQTFSNTISEIITGMGNQFDTRAVVLREDTNPEEVDNPDYGAMYIRCYNNNLYAGSMNYTADGRVLGDGNRIMLDADLKDMQIEELQTENKALIGAINELKARLDALENRET